MEAGLVEWVFPSLSKVLGDCFCGLQEFMVDCFTLYYAHVVVCIFGVHFHAVDVIGACCSILLYHAFRPTHGYRYEVNISMSG